MESILESGNRMRVGSVIDVLPGSMHIGSDPLRAQGRSSDCFVCVLEGDTEYRFADYQLNVKGGEVIYLPRGSTYQIRVKAEYRYIYVDFDFTESGFRGCVVKYERSVREMFERLLRNWVRGSDTRTYLCMGILYEIYARLLESSALRYVSPQSRAHVARAEGIINKNLSDRTLNIKSVAENVGVTPTHLRRLFYAMYGISPVQFVRQMRISQAKTMLSETEKSLAQIAEETGFCNEYYFSRVFSSEIGIPPGAFRRQWTI